MEKLMGGIKEMNRLLRKHCKDVSPNTARRMLRKAFHLNVTESEIVYADWREAYRLNPREL